MMIALFKISEKLIRKREISDCTGVDINYIRWYGRRYYLLQQQEEVVQQQQHFALYALEALQKEAAKFVSCFMIIILKD